MTSDPPSPLEVAASGDGSPAGAAEAERRRRATRALARRLADQWSHVRERQPGRLAAPVVAERVPLVPSTRAGVPWGLDLAAAYAWRFTIIVIAGYIILVKGIWYLREVTVPIAIALLLAALVSPLVRLLRRIGVPKGLASLLVVLFSLAVVVGLLTLATAQVAGGASDLADSTAGGLGQIRHWLKVGPLHASDSQINDAISQAQNSLADQAKSNGIGERVTEVGTAISKGFAGFFIVLFSTYFFLADGERIWAFLVRLAPRGARSRVDGSGRVAWVSLTQFVRATVIVAAVDAVGISVGAAILQVPLVLAIGVLVFLGAFVPVVGAFVAGAVAVLVALAVKGPVIALIMFAVVVAVQQLEAHVLQPFLLGRWVSVHPLAVIMAIAVGILLAGVIGGLVAVPLTAVISSVVQHLAAFTEPGADPVDELAADIAAEQDDGHDHRAAIAESIARADGAVSGADVAAGPAEATSGKDDT